VGRARAGRRAQDTTISIAHGDTSQNTSTVWLAFLMQVLFSGNYTSRSKRLTGWDWSQPVGRLERDSITSDSSSLYITMGKAGNIPYQTQNILAENGTAPSLITLELCAADEAAIRMRTSSQGLPSV